MQPKVLWTTSGIVEAPVERVAALVFEPYLRERGWDAHDIREYDEQARTLAVSGHWWYRGVTSVEPHERGALITHRVYNIAEKWRWMVGGILLQYRFNGTLQAIRDGGLPGRLIELGEHLGCRTELVESGPPER